MRCQKCGRDRSSDQFRDFNGEFNPKIRVCHSCRTKKKRK